MPKDLEADNKPKWFNAQKVKVNKIVLELTGAKDELVQRIRLETEAGNITYKPKKIIEQTSTIGDFGTESTRKENYTVTEFLANNAMLVTLAKNCKKEPQEIVISYAEFVTFNEKEKEFISYFYMLDNQFSTIYYKEFHKDDKSNLEKQKEKAKKFEEEEL